jgi:probable F420-dependent oxidoreductase
VSSAAADTKLGVFVGFGAHTSPEIIAATGRLAEERGLHSLWVPEHVLHFPEYQARYPYTEDGKMPGGPIGLMDPFTALTWIAAVTSRLRLGTGVCLVPQRNPIYTAKHVADLDFLSGGRVDFGVGIGWLREEFDALGAPWAERAARTRDYLALMKHLWCDDVPHHEGTHHSIPDCVFGPRPVQKPHPPIYFGGNSQPALRRVAEAGQGWYGHDLLPDAAEEGLARLGALLSEAGREAGDVRCVVSPFFAPVTRDDLARYRELGFAEVLLPLVGTELGELERRADELAGLRGGLD